MNNDIAFPSKLVYNKKKIGGNAMKISTKGRYALRVMIDIAMNSNGDYVSVKDIATRQDISKKYLEQIMTMLSKANLIETTRGNTGGYRLTRKPEDYTIKSILRATEGNLSPLDCLGDSSFCSRKENCKTHSFWAGLDNVINEYLESKTLKDLIK